MAGTSMAGGSVIRRSRPGSASTRASTVDGSSAGQVRKARGPVPAGGRQNRIAPARGRGGGTTNSSAIRATPVVEVQPQLRAVAAPRGVGQPRVVRRRQHLG